MGGWKAPNTEHEALAERAESHSKRPHTAETFEYRLLPTSLEIVLSVLDGVEPGAPRRGASGMEGRMKAISISVVTPVHNEELNVHDSCKPVRRLFDRDPAFVPR